MYSFEKTFDAVKAGAFRHAEDSGNFTQYSQMERSVPFPTYKYSSRNIPAEICRSIVTNRFISRLPLFT